MGFPGDSGFHRDRLFRAMARRFPRAGQRRASPLAAIARGVFIIAPDSPTVKLRVAVRVKLREVDAEAPRTMTVMMLALALGGEPPALRASPTDAKPLAKWSATDLSGNRHSAKDWKDRKAVAFLFVTTECPVAAFYLP